MNLIPYYAGYIAASLVITVWLARTLFHNGAVFLLDTFDGRPDLATAVNRLLVTGFFMLNLGYALWLIQFGTVETPTAAIEELSRHLGVLLVSLAVVHFVNLVVFNRIRAHSRSNLVPPLSPGDLVAPPPPAPMPPTTMPPAPRVAAAPILPAP